jgi:hypothetical protein
MLAGLPARAQDNVIGAAFDGLFKDFVGEEPGDGAGPNLDARRLERFSNGVQALLEQGLAFRCPQRPRCGRGGGLRFAARKDGSLRLDHVQKDDFGGECPRELRGLASDGGRGFSEVDRDEECSCCHWYARVRRMAALRLLVIDLGLVEYFPFDDWQDVGLSIKFLEEAAVVSGVACSPGLLDLEEEDVAIAVGEPAFDLLGVAARFALEPELFS